MKKTAPILGAAGLIGGIIVRASIVLVEPACSGDEPVACSNGPPYEAGTHFNQPPANELGGLAQGECVPRCDYGRGRVSGTSSFFLDALPSGSCTAYGHKCAMPIFDGCTHNAMQCECAGGEWQCVITLAGGASCPPRLDGGFDAGGDGG